MCLKEQESYVWCTACCNTLEAWTKRPCYVELDFLDFLGGDLCRGAQIFLLGFQSCSIQRICSFSEKDFLCSIIGQSTGGWGGVQAHMWSWRTMSKASTHLRPCLRCNLISFTTQYRHVGCSTFFPGFSCLCFSSHHWRAWMRDPLTNLTFLGCTLVTLCCDKTLWPKAIWESLFGLTASEGGSLMVEDVW